MTTHFRQELHFLEALTLQMSGLTSEVVRQSVQALFNPNPQLTREIAARDDRIDAMETRINESSVRLLALNHPVAKDLRQIATILKLSREFERIADVGINIAERGAALAGLPPISFPTHLVEMAEKAMSLLDQALESYAAMNRQEALDVRQKDIAIDELNRQIIDELTVEMKSNPSSIPAQMHLFSAARNIERVGDHATNIAEDVIYLIDGRIIRHPVAMARSANKLARESA